ncbi:hypothetical protein COCNU_contig68730636G000010 [Cocos nucifera]|nr:hypothetical protein [Cocos nucifera]
MTLNYLVSDGTFQKVGFVLSSFQQSQPAYMIEVLSLSGGFKEFGLMERLGEGKKPTAIIGEVADDLNLDLVVLSMEAIHSKHVDGNLLAEFIPCPVLLLPL